MSARASSTLVIGVLAAIACLLTAFVLPVPVWVVFAGWASFFTAGSGTTALARSLVMNLVGLVIAALALVAIVLSGGSPWVVAVSVGLGAAVLVVLSRYTPFSATPAGFLGFAATFGVFSATGADVFAPLGFTHPLVLTLTALVVGGLFGYLSAVAGGALTRKPVASV